ncbi:MAG: tetraacyldisaccharide 4'-kinase [Bacteroidota bacterium]
MKLVGLLLFPFSLLYGIVVCFRNKLFDLKILKSEKFNLPIISIGNLTMGGTGKTPHIEYLIRLLGGENKLATLSRGYGRSTKGFLLVDDTSNAESAGDEPLQYRNKFKDVKVAVDEKRCRGIKTLINKFPETDIILLDDAYQHRYVKPGLSILLTDFYRPFSHDYIFPSGTLREFKSGKKRADIIIVTKSPRILSPITCKSMEEDMKLLPNQQVYYSYIDYGDLVPLNEYSKSITTRKFSYILMFAGVANPYPMEEQLKTLSDTVEVLKFQDHYQYKTKDIQKIRDHFESIFPKNKVIITTEKDAMRIKGTVLEEIFVNLPIFYIPIEIKLHKKDKENFDNQIINYVRKNKGNN